MILVAGARGAQGFRLPAFEFHSGLISHDDGNGVNAGLRLTCLIAFGRQPDQI